jgi:hypothetical protein
LLLVPYCRKVLASFRRNLAIRHLHRSLADYSIAESCGGCRQRKR